MKATRSGSGSRIEDKTIELRQIKPGLTNGDLVEVVGNLKPGEQIVTKGSAVHRPRRVRQLTPHSKAPI